MTALSTFDVMALGLQAPLMAVDPDDFAIIHAAEMEPIVAAVVGGEPLVSACGVEVRLIPGPGDLPSAYSWPPRVADLPDGYSRCLACHKATGRMRPAPREEVTR